MTHPHLPKAPIREAILEIRTALPDRSPDRLDAFEQAVRGAGYVNRRHRQHLHFEVSDADAKATREVDGVLLQHETEPQVVQGRFDGFGFSRLIPYQSWEPLRDEAKILWETYRRVMEPTRVTRLGLRYVNTITVRLDEDIQETFHILPGVPEQIAPTGVNSFSVRLETEYPGHGALGTIFQHLPRMAPGDETVTMIFDVDVHKPLEFEPEDEAIWAHFEDLRAVKNQIFFGSVTSGAVERYKS